MAKQDQTQTRRDDEAQTLDVEDTQPVEGERNGEPGNLDAEMYLDRAADQKPMRTDGRGNRVADDQNTDPADDK